MIVGLTYDLRDDYLAAGFDEDQVAEFDRVDTIDALEAALRELGHETVRIGRVQALVEALAHGERWDLVFNIAEGVAGFGRESQVPALLEAYGIPCVFSDALTCALTLHKGMAKHVLRDRGIPTPDFALVSHADEADSVTLPFPLFVKPVAEGTSKGIGPDAKVTDRAALRSACARLLARFDQPVLVERFLPGREVTVGIVGTGRSARVLAVLEVELLPGAEPGIYTYKNKEECETRVRYALADAATRAAVEAVSLEAWRSLGCRDGGRVDLRAGADGRWQVLELNPLPGMHPAHSDLPIMAALGGVPFTALVGAIVESACERVSGARAAARDARARATAGGTDAAAASASCAS
ncbi:MAG: D-alanine--D-alanine ligase [Planctomycetes bacterium]|nr:D-alanine--D-alanine ligase [Planctomycetota bacterium]